MTQNNRSYHTADIKKLDKSQVEITATVATETWEKFRAQALKNINESVTVDGFRKGMVPEEILVAKAGEMTILEEMAELALSRAYLDILIDNKIDALGRPKIVVTKIAKGIPLEFKATTTVIPEMTLPDYKKIAKDVLAKADPKESEVTEKDIEEAILRIRKAHASHDGHDHEKMTREEHEKAIMDTLPELTDEFVQRVGEFTDVADFKKKIGEVLVQTKKDEAHDKRRARIADAISEKTEVELPEIMVESELGRIEAQFQNDVEKMGAKMEDYLKHAKKTMGDVHKEWRPYAEKKVKLQLILNSIAQTENLKPDQKEIDEEVSHIMNHYKNADRESATVYAETVLMNEKVFKFLEALN